MKKIYTAPACEEIALIEATMLAGSLIGEATSDHANPEEVFSNQRDFNQTSIWDGMRDD